MIARTLFFLTALVAVCFSLSPEEDPNFVVTPFGHRHKSCVVEIPHGAHAVEEQGRLKVTLPGPERTVKFYETPKHCGDDMHAVKAKCSKKDNVGVANGWLDYAGWYISSSGKKNFESFNSTYVVPGNPKNTRGNQVLFYFIGMQDNDSPAVNILQPVLTWGNGYREWYVKSWICCPANITVSSPPIFGLDTGDEIVGTMVRESPSTWLVDSYVPKVDKHTTLRTKVGDYLYNWADVTLEVYTISSCDDFATGKALFKDLSLADQNGDHVTPDWTYTKPSDCNGRIQSESSTSMSISH